MLEPQPWREAHCFGYSCKLLVTLVFDPALAKAADVGAGDDYLVDGPLREVAVDALSDGDGDDYFLVDNRPASRYIVSCGSGYDAVEADIKDVASDICELVEVD